MSKHSHPSFQPFLRYVWQRSEFYRSLYLEHGIREQDLDVIALQDLPVVTRQMILDNFDRAVTDARIRSADLGEWLTHDHDPRSRFLGEFLVLHSTGSSGRQTNIVYDEASWRNMTAAAAGYLYPNRRVAGTRYRNAFYIGDLGHVASATTAMNMSPTSFDSLVLSMKDPIEDTIARLNAFQPDRLTSYASGLGWLAELAMDGKLHISPQDIVASADRMTPAIEKKIRQAWNPNIFDLYAVTEALFIAVKQPGHSEWKVLDEIQTLEVLGEDQKPVKPGAMGRAMITNYTSRVLPFIRYDLTDYVIAGATDPGNSTLRGFVSRTFEDLPVRLNNGQTGAIPSYELANMTCASPDALQFITVSPDEVEIQYCSQENLDRILQAEMTSLLAKCGANRTLFRIRRVDHIWDDAYALKYKLVRRLGDVQLGLPDHILLPGRPEIRDSQLRPGDGFVPFAREKLNGSIAELFEAQAAGRPQAIAVKDGDLSITFEELNRAANRTAHALRARQMDPAHPVALLFSHRPAMITAMMGVIKAGGWYAPLDPAHPAVRNIAILREIGASLVMTDTEGLDSVYSLGFSEEKVINLDALDKFLDEGSLGFPTNPETPVCILYTSGSTGVPKGVVLDQKAVLHRAMVYTNDFAIGPGDNLALLQSYVFNASVREIFAALVNGASLHLYSLKRMGVNPLPAWLEDNRITVLYMVPTTFRVFLGLLRGEKFEKLRVIRLGGEDVLAQDVEGFQRHFGKGCILANGFAATETGTICQYFISHDVRITGKSVPIGLPVADKVVSLLDENGNPVEEGATGEIVVNSEYMGPGRYTQENPENGAGGNTFPGSKRVVHTGDLGYQLPNGQLLLAGRKDWQVKLRGQRINLLEIEHVLLSLENVAAAAVTRQEDEEGDAFLAAHIQVRRQPAYDENELRRLLRGRLPEVMIPSVFLFYNTLPLTVSGKVDRAALPAVVRNARSFRQAAGVSPETPTELALVEIWRELLGIEEISADDGFFELGGDSLHASVLMARIDDRFQTRVPISDLFLNGTLRRLAAVIEQKNPVPQSGLLFTIQPSGEQKPVFFFTGIDGDVLTVRALAAHMGNQHPIFGMRGADFGGQDGKVANIEQAAEAYAAEIQSAHLRGPYLLAGYSFGGHLALETARRLGSDGAAQLQVVLIDTYPAVPMKDTTLARRAHFHYNNLRRLKNSREAAAYFRSRLLNLYLRLLRHRKTRWIAGKIKAPDSSPISAAQIALANYRPQPYFGKVILFQAGQLEWYMDEDPMKAWGDVLRGELEIRTIPGEHLNLIKPPYVQELARHLLEVLSG